MIDAEAMAKRPVSVREERKAEKGVFRLSFSYESITGLERWTCNQQVAGSTPGHRIAE